MTTTQIQSVSTAYRETRTAFSLAGLLGVYFGVRVCMTVLFFHSDPQASAIVGFALNLLLLIPVVLYSAGATSIPYSQSLRNLPFRLVLAFLGLALISLLWSETQSRIIACAYWAAMASDVAAVFLLLHAEQHADATESLLKGFVYGAFLLAIVAWSLPAMSDMRLGDEEYLNPNAIGFECAFAALLCQHFAPQGARWKWLGAALVLTLMRSLSKTSIIAFAIVEIAYLFWTQAIPRATKLMLVGSATVVLLLFSPLIASYYDFYTNNGTQAETLTGRVGIWLTTLNLALEEPWLGHGFHAFRNVIPAFGDFEPWHAHNELLQQFFAYGIVGVILLVALYASLYRQARRHAAKPMAQVTLCLLLLVVIRGLTDTERFDLSFPLWSITAISLTLGQRQENPA